MPDRSPLATEGLRDQLKWSASAFDNVVTELKRWPPTKQVDLIIQMCEMGRDNSRRYASILEECVVIPLTDLLGEGEK